MALSRRAPCASSGQEHLPILRELFAHYDVHGDGAICPEAFASTQRLVRSLLTGLNAGRGTPSSRSCTPHQGSKGATVGGQVDVAARGRGAPHSRVPRSPARMANRKSEPAIASSPVQACGLAVLGVSPANSEKHSEHAKQVSTRREQARSPASFGTRREQARSPASFEALAAPRPDKRLAGASVSGPVRQNLELQVTAPLRSPSFVAYGEAAPDICNFERFLEWQCGLLDASTKSSEEKRRRLVWLVGELDALDDAESRTQFWRVRQAALKTFHEATKEVHRLEADGAMLVAVERLEAALKQIQPLTDRELMSASACGSLARAAVDEQQQYLADLQAEASKGFTTALTECMTCAALEKKLKDAPGFMGDKDLAPHFELLEKMRKPFTLNATTLGGSSVPVEVNRSCTVGTLRAMIAEAMNMWPYRIGIASASGQVLTEDTKALDEFGIVDDAQVCIHVSAVQKFREMTREEFVELLVKRRLMERRGIPPPTSDEEAEMNFRKQYIPRLEEFDRAEERQRERKEDQVRRSQSIAAEAQKWVHQLGREVAGERITRKITEVEEACGRQCAEAQAIKDDAMRDLDAALPALENAMRSLHSLDKRDLCEVRSFCRPPPLVTMVMEAVCILFGRRPTWDESKKLLQGARLLDDMIHYDKDNIAPVIIAKLQRYLARPEFTAEAVGMQSRAASSFCCWVHAMVTYDRIAKVVAPKRDALRCSEEMLEDARLDLTAWQEQLRALSET